MSSVPNHVNQYSESFDDIDRWQRGCAPQQSSQMPGLDAVADGALDCEIVRASLERTPKTQELIFKLHIRALTGPSAGLVFEKPRFFRSQNDLDWLAGELLTLGFPADRWLQAQSFGRELKAACPWFAGVRFQAKKSSKTVDGTLQHNFYVNARLSSAVMPSASPMPRPGAQQWDPHPAGDSNDIPF